MNFGMNIMHSPKILNVLCYREKKEMDQVETEHNGKCIFKSRSEETIGKER
jgi:hypothetical protein